MFIDLFMFMCINIYIYIERERERDRYILIKIMIMICFRHVVFVPWDLLLVPRPPEAAVASCEGRPGQAKESRTYYGHRDF